MVRTRKGNKRFTDVETGGTGKESKAAVNVTCGKIVRHVHGRRGKYQDQQENKHGLQRIFAALSGPFSFTPGLVADDSEIFSRKHLF